MAATDGWTHNILYDDFTGGASDSSSSIGETGWSIFSTADAGHSINYVAGEANHPGICAVSCAPVANSILACCRHRPNSTLLPPYFVSDVQQMTFVVRIPNAITSMRLLLGLAVNPIGVTSNVLNGGGDGVYAMFDPAVSAGWRLVVRSVGAQTATNTGVAVALNTWYQLRLVNGGNRWGLSINGGAAVMDATGETNPAGLSLCPTVSIQSTTANARTVHLDYAEVHTTHIRRF